jgi:hypothetical protein
LKPRGKLSANWARSFGSVSGSAPFAAEKLPMFLAMRAAISGRSVKLIQA